MTKNLILLILSLLFFKSSKAQVQKDTSKSDKDVVFTSVNKEPLFPNGGPAGFNAYLGRNIKFPKYDTDNKTFGKVIVIFIVEKDGTLSDVKMLRAPDKYIGEEAERVIRLSPPWIPGSQNGYSVRVQYTIAFSFDLSK